MAGAGAKKRMEENKGRVATLRIIVAVGAIAYIFGRLGLQGGWQSAWHWAGQIRQRTSYLCASLHHKPYLRSSAGLLLTAGVSAFTFSSIAAFAAPIYGPSGELLDGGADLSMKGACAYYHDLLYITSFVQV